MSEDIVTTRVDDRVGIVTLNRPERRNAITPALRDALKARIAELDADARVAVLLLRGEGHSFCAGYDLSSDDPEMAGLGHDPLRWHAFQSEGLKMLFALWEAKKPVIAAVQGHALGYGCALAMICDLVIAADDAIFGEPEIRFHAISSAVVMPWIIGTRRARELLYTGDTVDAPTAHAIGLVNRVVPAASLADAAAVYSARLAKVGAAALMRAKLAVNRGQEAAGFRNALMAGLDVVSPLYTTETAESKAFREESERIGLRAAIRRRHADFA